VDKLSLGVIARTRKENERRLPIHPLHLQRIAPELRERIHLEHGYGEPFGIGDDRLGELVAGLRTRQELIDGCDVILLAKPLAEDLEELREGQVLWGWPHCVQDRGLTQVAIDRRLTLIAFEAMNHWTDDGTFSLHVFHKNNELAGYCSVLHTFQLAGRTGEYGPRLSAAVIGSGATARGAVRVLNAHGVHDVDVLTHRDVSSVAFPIPSARLVQFSHDDEDPRRSEVLLEGERVPLAEFLASHDVIVNCVLQDPNSPLMFLVDEDLSTLRPGTLIVDVSCDEGMGFTWARPTTFEEPTFVVGDNVLYYGVDHSPSYLWDSASWQISDALLPHLPAVVGGPDAWDAHEIVRRAIEIRDGEIKNPDILTFQGR